MSANSDEEVAAMTEELIQRFQASGEYDRMRAMIMAASIESLAAEAGPDGFKPAAELVAARAANSVAFAIVGDFLRHMGLHYTFNVLAVESGIDKKTLDAGRASIADRVPGVSGNSKASALEQLAEKSADTAASASTNKQPAAAAPATVAPVAAATAQPAAKVPAPAVAATNMKVLPSTKNATPKAGKKGDESLYEIYYFDSGEFTRFNQIDGQPLQLAELRNCKIFCYDAVDNVTVDECEDCEIIIAACEGSIFLRDSKRLTVTAACKQLRTRDCHDCDVRLYAMTDPVVESSSKIRVRPFNLRLPNLQAKFARSKLDPKVNRFVHIYDFTPDAAKLAQPHFYIDHPNHQLAFEERGAELAPVDVPPELEDVFYNRRKPSESSEAGPNKSINIKTGAKVWTAEEEEEEEEEEQKETSTTAAAKAPAAAAPAPAPAPAAASPAAKTAAPSAAKQKLTGMLTRDSDSDKYSDYSDDADTPMSSVKQDEDDDDEF